MLVIMTSCTKNGGSVCRGKLNKPRSVTKSRTEKGREEGGGGGRGGVFTAVSRFNF